MLNFEGIVVFDFVMDGMLFFSGNNVYMGIVGGMFVVNMVDLFIYLKDLCFDMNDY